jgi:hypothetical protein
MKKWHYVGTWGLYVAAVGWLGFGVAGWQFLVGNIIAWGLKLVDRFVYAWWLYPYEQSSIQIQYWTRKRDVKAVLGLLTSGQLQQQRLIFKSLGFAVMWVLLAAYVASSTGSIMAMGIVMGLGFDLGWSIVKDWKYPDKLGSWFCWQIKRQMSIREVRRFGALFVGFWWLFVLRLILGK